MAVQETCSAVASALLAELIVAVAAPHLEAQASEQFAAVSSASSPTSLMPGPAWGDFDGDGLLDVFLVNPSGPDRLLRNLGDGRFADASLLAGLAAESDSWQASWIDYDEDGRLDLYVLSMGGESLLYRGLGKGTFEDATDAAGLTQPWIAVDAAWVDYDEDKRPDLRLTLRDGGVGLYHALGHGAFEPIALDLPCCPPDPILIEVPAGGAGASTEVGTASGDRPPRDADPSTPLHETAGRLRTSASIGSSTAPLITTHGGILHQALTSACTPALKDQAGGPCLKASATPTLGQLYPISDLLFVSPSGNVGVGTESPAYRLHVEGDIGAGADRQIIARYNDSESYRGTLGFDAIQLGDNGANFIIGGRTAPGGDLRFVVNNTNDYRYDGTTIPNGTQAMVITATAKVGIGTTNPQAALDVSGTTRTSVLTITGGSDLAEPFDVSGDDVRPGFVVCIDDASPGRLRVSDEAYDHRVAGIISGAGGIQPGLTMSQTGRLEGARAVALSGRVYCWCDARSGPIEPGDLLTTSAMRGHAMAATDGERRGGAVIGKAMSALGSGEGLVLVLVNLQ